MRVEVKVQPDDAEWDAGDIRLMCLGGRLHQVLLFQDMDQVLLTPRTGQILGADIMLEYSSFTYRVKTEKIFETFSVKNF